jgi:hypothetical protein
MMSNINHIKLYTSYFNITNMVWIRLSTPTIASNTENREKRILQYNDNQPSEDETGVKSRTAVCTKYISPTVHHHCHDGGWLLH